MNFKFLYELSAQADIEVDDIGNVSIEANTDNGNFYYLIIKSELGWTTIVEYGPIQPDFERLPKHIKYSYDEIPYSEKEIEKRIDKFLNPSRIVISQARIIDKEEIFDFQEYVSSINELIES